MLFSTEIFLLPIDLTDYYILSSHMHSLGLEVVKGFMPSNTCKRLSLEMKMIKITCE